MLIMMCTCNTYIILSNFRMSNNCFKCIIIKCIKCIINCVESILKLIVTTFMNYYFQKIHFIDNNVN